MEGISPTIKNKLEEVLLRCGPFKSDDELRRIFVDARISIWRDLLSQTTSSNQRVLAAIELLHDRYNDRQENALVLFLNVLSEQTSAEDICYRELVDLSRELARLQQAITVDPEKVSRLLRLAERELSMDNCEAALDLLHQAKQLKPEDSQITQRYNQIVLRKNIQNELRKTELDCEMRLASNSPHDAARVIYKNLEEILAISEIGLPVEVKNKILDLLRMGGVGGLYANDEWENVRLAMTDLYGYYRQPTHWLVRPVILLTERWLDIRRDIDIRGAIASLVALGDSLSAYRLADIYLRRHPTESFAIQQAINCLEQLLHKLFASSDKRLIRAQAAIEQGHFEIALENLDSLEEVYAPIEREFPTLLSGRDDFEDHKQRASKLREEALSLQSDYSQTERHSS
ncbi:MAG TPA: hypothetical protein PKH77_24535 [Anaerolineae bacterium]|nr:hypothetical protein [Anaerolineae bacterium]